MGELRFHVPNASQLDAQLFSSSYVIGIEGIPWACRSSVQEDRLTITRSIEESGRFSIVWPTSEFGPILLTTASLRCDDTEYLLPLELARGTLHRIRSRALDWQKLGLKIPEPFHPVMEKALQYFIQASIDQSDRVACCRRAQTAIEFALASTRPLCRAFISQSLQARHQQEPKLNTLMGVRIGSRDEWRPHQKQLLEVMNMAVLGLDWGKLTSDPGAANFESIDDQVEWARENSLRVCAGPLISLQPHAAPSWLHLLDHPDKMIAAACDFTKRCVERYRGKINLWNAATGLNTPNDLGLSDDQVLRLAVAVIQTIRRLDERTPVILTLDLPWAEYLGQKSDAISPLHFADALTRTDLGLSGLGVEINIGYSPGGSFPRDLVEISDLVDQWSILELPLMAMLVAPNDSQSDAQAFSKYGLVSQWKTPVIEPLEATGSATGQAPNGLDLFQVLLAKPNIHGIVWNQLCEKVPHPFPNSGLVQAQGNPRPLFEALARLRSLHVH